MGQPHGKTAERNITRAKNRLRGPPYCYIRLLQFDKRMAFLRRRFGGNDASSSEPSRESTPEPGRPSNLRVVTAEKLQTLKKGKSGKKKNFWIFTLGGIAGVVAAAFFAGSNDMIDFSSLEGVNLDSLYEALPAGFLRDAQQMQVGAGSFDSRHFQRG